MRKVLFVATVVKTHIMEFHVPYLKMFKDMGWETAVASRNDYEQPEDCVIPYCDHYYDIPFDRNPLKLGNIAAYKMLKRIIDEGYYDIIHCHTPVGAMLTRLAARQARRKGSIVIYTAHGFHFYKGAPLVNWLLYYPVEKWLAKDTDVLITIDREDYERAKKFKSSMVKYVPGVGIDTQRFVRKGRDRDGKREELGIENEDFVLLSVGELIPRKNYEFILRTISDMKNLPEYKKLIFLVCGRGILKDDLEKLCRELGIEEKVRFLGYRSDIPEICNASDLFVFMSKQEGLPVALMEAMACGLPAVCSDIRGNTDLITDGDDGLVIGFDQSELQNAILSLMDDAETRERFSARGVERVKGFDIQSVLCDVQKIYEESLSKQGKTLRETP